MRLVVVGSLALTGIALSTGVSSAHREFSVGPLDMEMGFLNEPAYTGQPNGTFVSVMRDGKPVEDVGDGLQVEVSFGDQTQEFPLEPLGEDFPGEYVASFIPTAPGTYTFHVLGTVEGVRVDKTFTSGPQTFDEVTDPTAVEFPVKEPTTGQLAQLLDRAIPRISQHISAVGATAGDAADSAKTLATIATVVGAAGMALGIAGVALGARRRRVA